MSISRELPPVRPGADVCGDGIVTSDDYIIHDSQLVDEAIERAFAMQEAAPEAAALIARLANALSVYVEAAKEAVTLDSVKPARGVHPAGTTTEAEGVTDVDSDPAHPDFPSEAELARLEHAWRDPGLLGGSMGVASPLVLGLIAAIRRARQQTHPSGGQNPAAIPADAVSYVRIGATIARFIYPPEMPVSFDGQMAASLAFQREYTDAIHAFPREPLAIVTKAFFDEQLRGASEARERLQSVPSGVHTPASTELLAKLREAVMQLPTSGNFGVHTFVRRSSVLTLLGPVVRCRGCDQPLIVDERIADGCPCNSPRGINHGLVPKHVCTCKECDPTESGSVRLMGGQGQTQGDLQSRVPATNAAETPGNVVPDSPETSPTPAHREDKANA